MAVSGVYSFTMTAGQIIEDALYNIGKLDMVNPTPTTQQNTHALRRLNAFLKALESERVYLYYIALASTTVSSASVSLSNSNGVIDAWLEIDSVSYPLDIMPIEEYDELPNKTTTGQPTTLYINKDYSTAQVYPVPDATYTLKYRNLLQHMVFTSTSQDLALPDSAAEMVVQGLSYKLGIAYGIPAERVQLMKEDYIAAKRMYTAFENQMRLGHEIVQPKGVDII